MKMNQSCKHSKIYILFQYHPKISNILKNSSNYRELQDHLLENLLGDTPGMQKILRLLYKVAPTTSSVLITGESGSGKTTTALAALGTGTALAFYITLGLLDEHAA